MDFSSLWNVPNFSIWSSIAFYSPTISMVTIPYSNIFFDGMLASGSVWAINAVVEWFEENKPPKNDDQGPGVV